ncbi:unnamed protein product [Euphydryas editha]|uniref:PiggyBac transposable element-derived protein domain-containing protein n=1 Tax=Euphydryas editha TaxID=104508 RepID=A0AAU9US50_EUPED|nr:unnamed protein product [Euphydryas editha]
MMQIKKKILYNPEAKDYHDANKKEVMWKSIVDEMKNPEINDGRLRKNRKGLATQVTQEKLKGVITALENDDGVLVLKWKDKRDILALFTKYSVSNVTVKSKRNLRKTIMKPALIADYNNRKCSIDLSDQMSSYTNPLGRDKRGYGTDEGSSVMTTHEAQGQTSEEAIFSA